MFTGIVEEVGMVTAVSPAIDTVRLRIGATATLHDPGEPPHWAPECGTPAYSTRHHTGA